MVPEGTRDLLRPYFTSHHVRLPWEHEPIYASNERKETDLGRVLTYM